MNGPTMDDHRLTAESLEDVSGFSQQQMAALERRTQQLGGELFAQLGERPGHIFQRRWWDDRVMNWAMQNESLKVEMFRFVDVLPMLQSDEAVTDHLYEYLDDVRQHLPAAVRVALGVAHRVPMTRGAVARAARLTAMDLARRFIAGTNVQEVLAAARRERELGRVFTLDILGEAVTSEVEAERYFQAYVELIEGIAPTVNGWPEIPSIDRSPWGTLPRFNLSIKLSAMDSQFDAIDGEGSLRRAGRRLRELLRVARRNQAFINVDMESYEKKDLTLWIFQQVLEEEEFRSLTDVGIVIQAYLKDSAADLVALRDWARRRGTPVWVRLVKGAYWDYETVHAQAAGWPIPVYQQKWQSDANFERLTRLLIQNWEHLRPAIGSHNVRSMAHALAVAEQLGLPPHALEPQMLYGMADGEKQALVDRGYRVRVYMPYGELIPGMAYLVRRLLENTSNDSFLRAGVMEQSASKELLRNPLEIGDYHLNLRGDRRDHQQAVPSDR